MAVLSQALWPLSALTLLLLLTPSPVTALNCMQDGDAVETKPREVNTRPEQDFKLSCQLDPQHPSTHGLSAHQLYFTRDFKGHRELIPDSQYTVTNSTLEVVDRQRVAVHHQYTCRVHGSPSLCFSSVNVGYPPLEAEDFSCISHNWENITCEWTQPYNAVRTTYQLMYRVGDGNGKLAERREQWAVCPEYKQQSNTRASCTMTGTSQPVYRHGKEWFNFTMNITNALGSRLQVLKRVHNFAIVLPEPPAWVNSSNVSSTSLQLDALVGYPMSEFPIPLGFQVTYTSPWDLNATLVNATVRVDRTAPHRPRQVQVTGLRPYTLYQFQVRIRSSATQREDRWSRPARHQVRTRPALPGAAPRVDVGSFQLVDAAESRTIYLYWRQIPDWQQNGPEFFYCARAESVEGTGPPLLPDLTTEAYARFSGVGLQRTALHVQACNQLGSSARTSELIVPDRRQIDAPPYSVTLLVIGMGRYQLIWKHAGSPPPASFSLFWCEQDADRSYQCKGQLDMRRVPGDVREYNLTLPTDTEYQFAVSANFHGTDGSLESSGMAWSRCSLLTNIDLQQVVEPSVKDYGPDYITLAWNNDCSSQAADIVSRFVVYYCPQVDGVCTEHEQRRELTGPISRGLRVDRLRPFTSYRMAVALVTGGKEGPRSAPKDTRTMEAVPDTTPTVTEVAAVSNTSLIVRWTPPVQPNGLLRKYVVYVSGREYPVENPARHKLVVQKLQPYTEYVISLQACNRAGCSSRSPPVQGRTLPGEPGRMEPVRSQLVNTSAVLLQWRPPIPAGGPSPIYQLRLLSEDDGHNYTSQVWLPEGVLEAEQAVRPCQPGDSSQRHLFWVRAVTRLPSGDELSGPWSEPTQQKCVLAADWSAIMLVGVVAGGFLAMALSVLGFFCLCTRTKRKWLKMRDIGVNLPSGLDRLEKPALAGLAGGAAAAGGYGRLVSSPDRDVDSRTRPLLQDDRLTRTAEEVSPCDATDLGDRSPSGGNDSNSCASSATTCTDSGAESEKQVGSPTSEITPWTSGGMKLAPYVQVGGGHTPAPSSASPKYSKFSPYVDAVAIRSLMARRAVAPPEATSRSEPDLSDYVGGEGATLPYTQLGHRSSAGYVSMTSQDGLAARRSPSPSPYQQMPSAVGTPSMENRWSPSSSPYQQLPSEEGPPTPEKRWPPYQQLPTAEGLPAPEKRWPPYQQLPSEEGPPAPEKRWSPYQQIPSADGAPAPEKRWSPVRSPYQQLPPAEVAPAPENLWSPSQSPCQLGGELGDKSPRLEPYVALGPPPPPVAPSSSVGFPSYVLAGLPESEVSPSARERPAAGGKDGYVAHGKLKLGGIELRLLTSTEDVSASSSEPARACSEPVLSPKKLSTVASSREPYCRVVTSHPAAAELGPNVSMV